MSWDNLLKTLAIFAAWIALVIVFSFGITHIISKVVSDAYGDTKRYDLTTKDRIRVGDIYNPGSGRRLQIRNKSRQIIGYIEPNGTITNKWRGKQGGIELRGVTVR